jgi:hypothetical protein
MIGQSLLHSAHKHFGFQIRIPQDLIDSRGDVPYDHLALAFQINNSQLHLEGICRTEPGYESFPPGVVLSLDLQPLVQSSPQTLDSVNVINVVAPTHSVRVPLSSQTRSLMHVLVPPSRPLPRGQDNPPRIRSAELWTGGPTISQPK